MQQQLSRVSHETTLTKTLSTEWNLDSRVWREPRDKLRSSTLSSERILFGTKWSEFWPRGFRVFERSTAMAAQANGRLKESSKYDGRSNGILSKSTKIRSRSPGLVTRSFSIASRYVP